MLYELLTGSHPFPAKDAGELMSAILRDPPTSLTKLRPDVPHDLARVLRRCLEKDLDRRMQTALDLRIEFEDLQAGTDMEQDARDAAPASSKRLLVPAILVALVVVVVAVNGWLGSDEAAVTYIARPMTGTLGWDCSPNWSPESEFIAFARVSAGSFHALVIDGVYHVEGGEEKPVFRAAARLGQADADRWDEKASLPVGIPFGSLIRDGLTAQEETDHDGP